MEAAYRDNILNKFMKMARSFKEKKIIVVGDYFLDRYVYISDSKTGVSVYTGQPAFEADKIVTSPGAAGTVAKNLAFLGLTEIYAVGFCGKDGDGCTLKEKLSELNVNIDSLITVPGLYTPSYTMMMRNSGEGYTEAAELAVQNQNAIPAEVGDELIRRLYSLVRSVKPDAVIFLDQLHEQDHGAITAEMRLAADFISRTYPEILTYVDSRSCIDRFAPTSILKCNSFEFEAAYSIGYDEIPEYCKKLSERTELPVVVTLGSEGAVIGYRGQSTIVTGFRVEGAVDTRGAGDAFTCGFLLSLLCGADVYESAVIGNASAACCVSQIAATGRITRTDVKKVLDRCFQKQEV